MRHERQLWDMLLYHDISTILSSLTIRETTAPWSMMCVLHISSFNLAHRTIRDLRKPRACERCSVTIHTRIFMMIESVGCQQCSVSL